MNPELLKLSNELKEYTYHPKGGGHAWSALRNELTQKTGKSFTQLELIEFIQHTGHDGLCMLMGIGKVYAARLISDAKIIETHKKSFLTRKED